MKWWEHMLTRLYTVLSVTKFEDGPYGYEVTLKCQPKFLWWRGPFKTFKVRGGGGSWSFYPSGKPVLSSLALNIVIPAVNRYEWKVKNVRDV